MDSASLLKWLALLKGSFRQQMCPLPCFEHFLLFSVALGSVSGVGVPFLQALFRGERPRCEELGA
jgi:hypothetical protein